LCYIRDNPVCNGRRHFFWSALIFHDEIDIQFSNDSARTECCWREGKDFLIFFHIMCVYSVQIINAQIMKGLIENLNIKNLMAEYIE
jgi:hypothetical protein